MALLLAGCALAPPRAAPNAECRDWLAALDQRVAAAGVRDGGAAPVPGYPYLRADRFGASFRDEVKDNARFAAWLERLRAGDREARGIELANLGGADTAAQLARAEQCGDQLAQLELADAPARAALAQAVHVPDDYSPAARFFGLYWFAVPFLDRGIAGYQKGVREEYARPLAQLSAPAGLIRWNPPAAAGLSADQPAIWLARRDALGIPQLSGDQWQELALAHAPVWWIESGGGYDQPGMPALTKRGPRIDADRPVTYFQPAFTRFRGRVLPQLVYTVWFSERPPQKHGDAYAGAMDGIVWRVTLDERGRPLVYDTIHPCGCYHYWYPAQPLARRAQGGFFDEPVLFPQDRLPDGDALAIRVQSATHYVRRVVAPADAVAAQTRSYELRPYRELLSLEFPGRGRRSLFRPDGIVDGSERGERRWLWVSGIPSPGAMRQWGRHATSFVGRSHFDDPRLLDRLFQPLPPGA